MVSAAAGLATTGQIPFVATFASFLALLCCEQIRTDVAFPGLPVRLIGHHSGFTLGFYGSSHHATEDIAIMRSLAGLAVVAPADGPSLAAALRATIGHPVRSTSASPVAATPRSTGTASISGSAARSSTRREPTSR